MAITYEHAKRLVLTSAAIMEREPEKHGYRDGGTVPFYSAEGRRSCFCLLGGAAALRTRERGKTFTVLDGKLLRGHFWAGLREVQQALHKRNGALSAMLIAAHDTTRDASEMAAKVRAIFAAHDKERT